MPHSGDLLYLLHHIWGLRCEHSNGLGAKTIWKLLHSHVWCQSGVTQTSWDS